MLLPLTLVPNIMLFEESRRNCRLPMVEKGKASHSGRWTVQCFTWDCENLTKNGSFNFQAIVLLRESQHKGLSLQSVCNLSNVAQNQVSLIKNNLYKSMKGWLLLVLAYSTRLKAEEDNLDDANHHQDLERILWGQSQPWNLDKICTGARHWQIA